MTQPMTGRLSVLILGLSACAAQLKPPPTANAEIEVVPEPLRIMLKTPWLGRCTRFANI